MSTKITKPSVYIPLILFVFLMGNISVADGPIRRWLRGEPVRQTQKVYVEPEIYDGLEYYGTSTIVSPVCYGPDCQVPKTSWTQPQTNFVVSQPPQKVSEVKTLESSATVPLMKMEVSKIETATSFHKTVIKSAIEAHKRGEITRFQLVALRTSMLSPAFRSRAESLAVVQIASSDSETTPFKYDDNGEIIKEVIDWEGLTAFIEKLIPLIIQLISIFGGM